MATEGGCRLPSGEHDFAGRVTELLDSRRYEEAISLIHERLAQGMDTATVDGVLLKSWIAGTLIDIGSEGNIGHAVKEGMDIFVNERERLNAVIDEHEIEYCLGNARSALFALQASEPGFRMRPGTIDVLTKAKNHFWRAYKRMPATSAPPHLLVNLANALRSSGRVAEALQYYDSAILERPDHPEAHANRAEALWHLNRLSGSLTANMLWQMMKGYDMATRSTRIPEHFRAQWRAKRDYLRERLVPIGQDEDRTNRDLAETQAEANAHSQYRKFCLTNHLTLSEHSLYCPCIGAQRDDLAIPKSTAPIGGEFVPRMILLLNRLKSEFALARLLYYRAVQDPTEEWVTFDEELEFAELEEGEAIGVRPEMLRTAFRMCFGILDKIASGVCELFQLAGAKEPIYFHSFWREKQKGKDDDERWAKINSLDNLSLLALYSQATDLSQQDGEWRHFKRWRNALEHGMLVLFKYREEFTDPMEYGLLDWNRAVVSVPYDDFVQKTLQMLQLARSAIFNFVFCVRQEGEKEMRSDRPGLPLTIPPKY